MEENKVCLGRVIFFNKGFGFLAPDEGGNDVFVHFSDINIEGFKTLKKDQKVSFQLGTNIRGEVKAVNVTPID